MAKMVQEKKKQSCLTWAIFRCIINLEMHLSVSCKTNFRDDRVFYLMLYQLSHWRLKDFDLFSITQWRYFLNNYKPSMKLLKNALKKMPSKYFRFKSFTKWLKFCLFLSVLIFCRWKPSCPKFLRIFFLFHKWKFHR